MIDDAKILIKYSNAQFFLKKFQKALSLQAYLFINPLTRFKIMKKYVCAPCGYEYDPAVGDPDNGIAPGTPFEELPDDWTCPLCGVGKDMFSPVEG